MSYVSIDRQHIERVKTQIERNISLSSVTIIFAFKPNKSGHKEQSKAIENVLILALLACAGP